MAGLRRGIIGLSSELAQRSHSGCSLACGYQWGVSSKLLYARMYIRPGIGGRGMLYRQRHAGVYRVAFPRLYSDRLRGGNGA
jgi:hypothetical protein